MNDPIGMGDGPNDSDVGPGQSKIEQWKQQFGETCED